MPGRFSYQRLSSVPLFQKKTTARRPECQSSQKFVTTAGIHGTVSETDEKTMTLQIADNVKMKFEKTAIANKL